MSKQSTIIYFLCVSRFYPSCAPIIVFLLQIGIIDGAPHLLRAVYLFHSALCNYPIYHKAILYIRNQAIIVIIIDIFLASNQAGINGGNVISFAASPSLPPLGETAWDRDHDRDRSRERNRERERVRERSGENERERQQEREPAIREREARDRERERDRDRQRDRERDRERDVSVCMMEPPESVFISPTAALLALQRIKDASL